MLLHQSYRPLDQAKQASFEELVRQLAQKTPLWHMACNIAFLIELEWTGKIEYKRKTKEDSM
jgi:hypothetical protein